MFNTLDNNSTEVSLGLAVSDLIRWHISSWVSGEGCSLHLLGGSAYISDALAQTEISFYLLLKGVSPAGWGAEHSLPSHHRIASAFQSTKRGQWGEAEGHLPPAMAFVNLDPSNCSFCRKCSPASLQSLWYMQQLCCLTLAFRMFNWLD